MIVCVSANPSIDKLFEVGHVTTGAVHRPLHFVQVAGGKGLNVARAANALGADAQVAALLGGHTGRWIADVLEAEGIQGHFAWTEAETRSCLSVADQAGKLTEFYETGQEIDDQAWDGFSAVVKERLEGASWLILSGSLPVGAPPGGYADLIGAARSKGVCVALDTRDESLACALPAGPDIIKVNAAEAGDLVGSPVADPQQLAAVTTELRARAGGKAIVILTRGTAGAVGVVGDTWWRGRSDVRGPYPVGSGDAFLAGMVTALDRGAEWRQTLALALGAGAANAEQQGAGRLHRERAEAIASAAEIVKLAHSLDE
jgi:1-phosphofructokinase family hexose kinase